VSGSNRRRRHWFDIGEAALRRVAGTSGVYRCPCCLNDFDRSAIDSSELTDAAVPPFGLGAQPRVLVCRSCNESSRSDEDAVLRERIQSTVDGPRNGRWEPPAVSRMWLRQAYLGAFGALGYCYILDRPELDELRSRLREPETRIGAESVWHSHWQTPNESHMSLVRAPELLQAKLVVRAGSSVGVIPGLASDAAFFDRTHAALVQLGINDPESFALIEFDGEEIVWPDRPGFALDVRE